MYNFSSNLVLLGMASIVEIIVAGVNLFHIIISLSVCPNLSLSLSYFCLPDFSFCLFIYLYIYPLPPGMLLPLDLLLEYWIEHFTIGSFNDKFVFLTSVFYSRSSRLCNWLCFRFSFLVLNETWFVSVTNGTPFCSLFLILFFTCIYLNLISCNMASPCFIFTFFSRLK